MNHDEAVEKRLGSKTRLREVRDDGLKKKEVFDAVTKLLIRVLPMAPPNPLPGYNSLLASIRDEQAPRQ